MPLAFPPDTSMFAKDQVIKAEVNFWDTPFTPLRNDIASGGVRFTMREPLGTAAQWTSYVAGVEAAAAGSTNAAFQNTGVPVRTVVSFGRTANCLGYWAGGAPGYHGSSIAKSVAYEFEGWVRTASARDWFSPNASFTATVACAGYGLFKVVHRSGATATTIINTRMTERGYLDLETGGPVFSAPLTLTTDDKLELYYLQDQTTWGGFVFKLLPGSPSGTLRARQAAMRDGAIIGAGLIDDRLGANPVDCEKRTLSLISDVQVTHTLNQTPQASFRVPLVNNQVWDGVGWRWVHDVGDDAGHLRLHTFEDDGNGGVVPVEIDVRRQRLVRIKGGFQRWDGLEEMYPLFTGFIDDFSDAASGVVTVQCLGVAQKMADQFVRNYPDKISYMTYGYSKLSGTSEPVYDTTAYDNWPMEYVLRDLATRAGIDEGRTRAPLLVPLADGSSTSVVM